VRVLRDLWVPIEIEYVVVGFYHCILL
jgi:hypothetical protein